ncbi:MAG: hypothetical protein JNK78_17740 [Planctomycetes bacterium]|nr:hypothetical protein [Planctomycetota bacterium]
MKLLRHLARPAALLPVLAVGVWTSLACRLPESIATRRALGEVTMLWAFPRWNEFTHEPAHPVPRLIELALLHLPFSAVQYVAIANALVAACIVVALASLVRRAFACPGAGQSLALAVGGLLVCTPAFGADWLHGERVGVFLPPLLVLLGLLVLHGDRRTGWRGIAALLLAGLAPFCHGNGILVFVALLPSLVDASRRAGGTRTVAWIAAALLVGNVAAAVSLLPAGTIALDGTGLVGRLFEAPLATLHGVAVATGAACLDPLPGTDLDAALLGAAAWLSPLLMWRAGDRSDAARRAAAPWWGCLWFGLLVPAWLLERHGVCIADATLRELAFGAFLLPVGIAGVAAARFSSQVLPFAAGALAILAIQDWQHGIETLRVAAMRVRSAEAAVTWPDVHPAERPASVLPMPAATWVELERRGWVPAQRTERAAPASLLAAEPASRFGSCHGGDARTIRGTVRSSLFGDAVQCVLVVAARTGAEAAVVGRTQPDYAGRGRDVPWLVALDAPLEDGVRVRAIGLRPKAGAVALGPWFVVRGGALVIAP